ncbi:MAG: hypothetical protein RIC35_03220 [Marinoscillum sp.]
MLLLVAYTGSNVYGQIITDSDKKLKTQKSKKKDGLFGLFDKKKGKSASGPFSQKKSNTGPRTSDTSPFTAFNKRKNQTPRSISSQRRDLFKKQRYTAPRYSSSGMAGIMSGKKKPTPRYSSGQPFTKKDKAATPRYSSQRPFQKSFFAQMFERNSGPRYSPGSPFSRKEKLASPRYSGGMPFTRKDKSIKPRYSPGSPFEQNFFSLLFDKNSGPRYSQGQPFSKREKTASPRYSAGSPFDKTFLERLFSAEPQIKYSAGSPFTKKDKAINTRYSAGSPFTKKDKAVNPRYSAGSPFTNKDKQVTPRYSKRDPYKKSFFARLFFTEPVPRYSAGSPFDSRQYLANPRYSTNKNRFDVNERMKKQTRYYDVASTKYRGTYRKPTKLTWNLDNLVLSSKTKRYEGNKMPRYDPEQNKSIANYTGTYKQKSISQKKMHPSAKHLTANQDSDAVRSGIRKWNIFWNRLNRNKVQPDAVTDKISKPKFDRKEAKIWNE